MQGDAAFVPRAARHGAFGMRREPRFDQDWGEVDEDEIRVLKRPRPFARLRLAGQFVFAAALVAGLTIAAKDKMNAGSTPRAWAEPARVASAPLARTPMPGSGPLLRLDAPAGEEPARSEPPRWSPATGLREDALSSGGFDAIEAPFLRVTVTETTAEAEPAASLFVTLARRAAEGRGLSVIRTGVRGQVETKFGPVEIVEATLSGQGQRACTGFQSLAARNLRIDGWLCGVLGQAPEPRAVACALDRLKLAGQAAPTVETAFSEAEARRVAGCSGNDVARRAADSTGSIAAPKKPPAKK